MLQINEVTRLYLGIQGENLEKPIEINAAAWLVDYPNGTISIWHKRNGDSVPSPTGATLDRETGVLTWNPTNTDTYVDGEGTAEIRLTESSVIKKSRSVVTAVSPSVTGAGSVSGSGWQDYIDIVEGYKNAAEVAQEAAEDAQEAAEDARDVAKDAQAAAEAARDAAQAAAGDFQGITATASGLEAGADPTVAVTHSEGGLYNFGFGIPKGDKGDQGDPPTDAQVQTAANTYLATVITNPDSPPLDRSLSSSSSAAPADMVGDLKSAFIANGLFEFENGFISGNGTFTPNDGYRCTTFIPLDNVDYINVKSGAGVSVNYYNGSFEHQVYTPYSGTGKINLNKIAGFKYIRAWIDATSVSVFNAKISIVMLNPDVEDLKGRVSTLESEETALEAEDVRIVSVMDKYPFDQAAICYNAVYVNHNIPKIAKRIKDIQIYGWKNNYTYYISDATLNGTLNGNPYTHFGIKAKKDDGTIDTYCFDFTDTTQTFSGVKTFELTPYGGNHFAGDKCSITIDFTDIPSGGIASSLGITITPISAACARTYVPTYKHPFLCEEPSDTKAAKVYNAVKDFRIFGAEQTDNIRIVQFFYNNSTFTPASTYITLQKGNSYLCRYYSSIVETGVKEIHFAEVEGSGVDAVAVIDFSQFTDNFQLNHAGTDAELGISKECYVQDEEIVSLEIPDTVYAVVGYETNIYWNAAVKCGNINDYKVLVTGKGENVGNRWRYTPSSAETFNINILVKNQSMRTVAKKTVSVVAKAKAVGSATTIKAIHIGDSMIDNQYHIQELIGDFAGTNITYNTYGTENEGRDEGRGGWTSGMYLTTASDGGVQNAFYNPTSETFDFSYYMEQHSNIPVPDYVFIFLGTNDVKGTSTMDGLQYMTGATSKNIETMIQSIKDYNSSIKVCVCTPAIGAEEQYPYGLYLGDNRIKQPLHRYGIQLLVETMMDKFCGRESEGIYFIPTGISLDNVNGFPTTTVDASARITKEITVQSDMYHPTGEGYHQFADCEFAFIRNQIS